METVGVAVVVFGPLAAFFLLLYKSIRRMMPARPVEQRPWARPANPAADREPRRPLIPSLSGAASLDVPREQDEPLDSPVAPRTAGGADPGHRLAG